MDIVKKLTLWAAAQPRTDGASLALEAISYIEALQKELEEEARINGMGGEREARLMAIVAEKESEIARLRLTDAEREAVKIAETNHGFMWQNGYGICDSGPDACGEIAATLRGLLGRTGGER